MTQLIEKSGLPLSAVERSTCTVQFAESFRSPDGIIEQCHAVNNLLWKTLTCS